MTVGSKSYPQLLETFAPRLIETDAQYWETQAVIDDLLARQTLSAAEESYLDLLVLLIEQHDKQANLVPELRGVALLQQLMHERELKQKDLLTVFKHRSTVSDVLNGRRNLTLEQVEKLADYFDLPPGLFLEFGEVREQVRQQNIELLISTNLQLVETINATLGNPSVVTLYEANKSFAKELASGS